MSETPRAPQSLFAPPRVELISRADGSMVLRSRTALAPYSRCVGEYLEHWADSNGEQPFMLERDAAGLWRGVTYAQARHRVRRLASGLLKHDLSTSRPLAILSENSIEHALLMLAAMHVGIPSVSVSTAHSLLSKDFAKLKRVMGLVEPGMIFVRDRDRFARALEAIRSLTQATLIVGDGQNLRDGEIALESLETLEDHAAVERAYRSVGPDTVAKLLFTSGSTGEPKGVINTQRMLCSNQQARSQLWSFLAWSPPVLVDWLPWSHTFGGNFNINMVLRHGGTFYIDAGRPAPGLFEQSIANLREVRPTVYCNVPRAYDMLVTALRNDAALRQSFFERLQVMFYAAAALPQNLWDALQSLALETRGEPVPIVSSWGSTETGPLATDCHFPTERSGVIGVPVPGCELKLVLNANKLEARVRGPNVTPGYWKRADLTASQFDDEGFYRIGDAVRFVDIEQPQHGLLFDGRVAEDFKLDSGTWVNASMLRVEAVTALAPVAQDIVITGHGRNEIAALVFPNFNACRQLCEGIPADAPIERVLSDPRVKARVAKGLATMASANAGSSARIARALLMSEPASIDSGEITDKGYINQSAVLERRAALVHLLYAATEHPHIVTLGAREPP